jgi:small subunit ribosomal protein S21
MLIVKKIDGEPIDKVLKRLKFKVIKSKQNQILFEKKYYTKKSVMKRDEKNKAKYREIWKNR